MIILSCDPSSTISGICILQDDQPIYIGHFSSNKKEDIGTRLYNFGEHLQKIKNKNKFDLVVVELMAMARNTGTARILSYFAAIPLLKAGQWNVPTKEIRTTSARKSVLGKGNLTKLEVYQQLSVQYSLSEYNSGGSDESDALLLGLCAYKEYG